MYQKYNYQSGHLENHLNQQAATRKNNFTIVIIVTLVLGIIIGLKYNELVADNSDFDCPDNVD